MSLPWIEYPSGFTWRPSAETLEHVEIVRRRTDGEPPRPLETLLAEAASSKQTEIRLDQLITSGDRVALAVDPSLPSLLEFVPLFVRELERLGASQTDLMILLPPGSEEIAHALREQLSSERLLTGAQVLIHDPSDRSAIAYMAATAAGNPIYIARTLVDADVVIPLLGLDSESSSRKGLVARTLYQHFAGAAETRAEELKRKKKPSASDPNIDRDAGEALWQLGVLLGFFIDAGEGGSAAGVSAGAPDQIDQAAGESARQWRCDAIAPAGLVIAEISGGIEQQNWISAAKALRLAGEMASPGGMIAILSDIAEHPGDRKRLAAAKAGKASGEDAGLAEFAAALEAARNAGPVFFLSRLSQETTEEAGMGYLSRPDELTRLIERQPRSILIRDAQHVRIGAPERASSARS